MKEKEIIHRCLELVAAKANRNSVADWTDGNFIELSEAIELETGFAISRNTLKRLFGRMRTELDYRPQRETRNALAMYAGYKDWDGFKIYFESIKKEETIAEVQVDEGKPVVEKENPGIDIEDLEMRGESQKSWIFGIIMLLIMIMAVFYWKSKLHRPAMPKRISSKSNGSILKCTSLAGNCAESRFSSKKDYSYFEYSQLTSSFCG